MKFFTKGSGVGRKVIPVKNDSISSARYKRQFSPYEDEVIKKADKFYKYSRHIKDLEQKLKSELGTKRYKEILSLYDEVSDPKFDVKKFLKENDAWLTRLWSPKALKRMFYSLPLTQYKTKIGVAQPQFIDRDEQAFIIAGIHKGIPEDVLYQFIILNSIPTNWSRTIAKDDEKPVAFYNLFKDLDISSDAKRTYKNVVFVEPDDGSYYVPEGSTTEGVQDVIKKKWDL